MSTAAAAMTIAAEQRSGTAWLNAAGRGEAEDALLRCCSSRQFAAEMAAALPYTSVHDALQLSRRVWWNQVGPCRCLPLCSPPLFRAQVEREKRLELRNFHFEMSTDRRFLLVCMGTS